MEKVQNNIHYVLPLPRETQVSIKAHTKIQEIYYYIVLKLKNKDIHLLPINYTLVQNQLKKQFKNEATSEKKEQHLLK